MSYIAAGGTCVACPSFIGLTGPGGAIVGDFYVAEDGTTFYVTENGLDNYTPEVAVVANNYAAENGTDLYVAENGTDTYVTET